jgi:small subunit ribosomal protein S16
MGKEGSGELVKIRLRRMGAKNQPHYRVVVADSRAPRDGRFIETIGYYNPRTEPPTVRIDKVRAIYWLERGAQPTEAVARLLTKLGISERWAWVKAREPLEEVVVPEVAEAEAPADLGIDEIGLPTRLTNILTSAGITKVSELKEGLEKGELSSISGLGPKSLKKIKKALEEGGL